MVFQDVESGFVNASKQQALQTSLSRIVGEMLGMRLELEDDFFTQGGMDSQQILRLEGIIRGSLKAIGNKSGASSRASYMPVRRWIG